MKQALIVSTFFAALVTSGPAQAAGLSAYTGQVHFPGGSTFNISIQPDSATAVSGTCMLGIFSGGTIYLRGSFGYTRAGGRFLVNDTDAGGTRIELDIPATNPGSISNPGTIKVTTASGLTATGTVSGSWKS